MNTCKLCNVQDDKRMVKCNQCDRWYHFDCAGVSGNIYGTNWICGDCNLSIAETTASASAPPSKMQNAPTEHQECPRTSSPKSTIQQNKLFQGPTGGVKTSQSILWNTADETQSPLEEQHGAAGNMTWCAAAQSTLAWTRTSSAATSKQSIMHTNIPKEINTAQHSIWSSIERPQMLPNTRSDDNEISNARTIELRLAMLEEEKKIQQSYLEKKYEILSQPHGIFNNTNTQVAPTPRQLAARQAIPKELPQFHGDAEDWPLFICSYETSTEVAGYSNAENLMRLQACLKGRAREMVRSKLVLPTMVPEIIKTLQMCFGRPELILENLIEKARKTPPLKDKLESLIEFALCVRNVYSTMESCHMDAYMNNPMLVKELVGKLPGQYKLNWAMHPKDNKEPAVKLFSDWLYSLAEAASQVVSPITASRSGVMNTHVHEEGISRKMDCAHCKTNGHKITNCERFKGLSLEQRWEVVRKLKLCRQCLNLHRRRCFINKTCGIEGCNAKHHQLLHRNIASTIESQRERAISDPVAAGALNSHKRNHDEDDLYFRILPVRIYSENNHLDTFAFLDEGSSVTLLDEDIFNQLKLKGVHDPLCLRWTGDKIRNEETSMRTTLSVGKPQGGERFKISGVHTVGNLGLPTQTVDMNKISQEYPYLAGLPIKPYVNAKPTILIGANNWKLAVPLKIREGSWHQPIATKTRLGWAIQGRYSGTRSKAYTNIHTCECRENYDQLHELVKDHFKLDSANPSLLLPQEDQRAMKMLESTCRKIDGRYEVGLLWRHDKDNMPDSYETALKLLMCLTKKFNKDPSLKLAMQKEIDNLIEKGYIKKLNSRDLQTYSSRVWYLPIFVTRNPNKPERLRLVWDAAAKTKGVSLNDFILPGPDLFTPLVDILINFRIGKVAICGDIAEMFHQINVRSADMHVQRFLWWDKDDPVGEPSAYVMRALTFGVNCAPCIAHYVRDKNADNFIEQFPRAVNSIKKHHYVDDFICSAESEQATLELAKTVKFIHASAGFNIRRWSSNSMTVVTQLTGAPGNSQDDVQLNRQEKILGIYWDPKKDVFKYAFRFARLKRNVISEDITPTKREILQVLMSIFDPLGFLSHYTIALKILLQEIWRSRTDWDEELSEDLFFKWRQWRSLLPQISIVEIPRCYSQLMNDAEDIQLHTFVDAGENGYAAVCYLRIQSASNVEISLVAAKSKVTPLKPLSIPRLELQAAIIGVRLASSIQKATELRLQKKLFWTDSKTVLQWLGMNPRRFQQFVMYRVAEILENTNLDQWKWVPSKMNPADLATKTESKADPKSWFSGPTFLSAAETDWPGCNDFGPINTSEIRYHMLHTQQLNRQKLSINTEYFSRWKHLYRALATFMLYVQKLKARIQSTTPPKYITFEIIEAAKLILIRHAQLDEYSDEIINLIEGKNLKRNSKLISLNVYIDDMNLIRVKGRADFLNPRDVIVLPSNHYITYLIVKDSHERYHHLSHETVINELKGKYFIPRLRVMYRKVRNTCQRCKNLNATPRPPQMAALPAARLASYQRPFSYVGIDYFGPMFTVVGRRREKRWGVIFTCLTIRAIHIEIAHSLDTNSCILCFRNFISRRGLPREVYTDNGTNFKATGKMLREELERVNYLVMEAKYDEIKWNFNPPSAPHMGGAWERLIRSIKTVLNSLKSESVFSDESLRSALLEVEFIINSRPLTFVSVDSCDDEAITPNHLLIGTASGYKPIGFSGDLRQRFRQTQLYADRFWQRWVKEYRPILTRRSKWFTKQPPLNVGDVVVIVDENQPRNCWPKGIITDVIIAKDGQVRRATVRTKFGLLERPAIKLAVLDVRKQEE